MDNDNKLKLTKNIEYTRPTKVVCKVARQEHRNNDSYICSYRNKPKKVSVIAWDLATPHTVCTGRKN